MSAYSAPRNDRKKLWILSSLSDTYIWGNPDNIIEQIIEKHVVRKNLQMNRYFMIPENKTASFKSAFWQRKPANADADFQQLLDVLTGPPNAPSPTAIGTTIAKTPIPKFSSLRKATSTSRKFNTSVSLKNPISTGDLNTRHPANDKYPVSKIITHAAEENIKKLLADLKAYAFEYNPG